jgi:CheY-like chemotaxis protein
MAKMLCRLGHHVTTAKNGKEGLEVINAAYRLTPDSPAVDIVFLDKYVHPLPSLFPLSDVTNETQSNARNVWSRSHQGRQETW